MSIKNLSEKHCLLVAALSLYAITVTAQDEQQIEYKSLLEFAAANVTETMPKGWSIVVGDASPGSGEADSALWRVENDGSGISITPQTQPLCLISPVLSLDDSCVTLSGVVLGSGSAKVEAQIRWMSKDAVVDVAPLREPPISNEANRRFNLAETNRPDNTDAAQLLLTVYPDNNAPATFRCAAVNLTGAFSSVQSVTLCHNKIGYEQIGPKFFTVHANFIAREAKFTVNAASGENVFSGELSTAERIQGTAGAEWEGYYYRGDFSVFEEEGDYVLAIALDEYEPVNAPIRIGFNLLWDEAFAPVLAPFKRLRVEPSEEKNTLQLWNPAFAGEATDAALLWDIVRSWSIVKGRFRNDPAFVPLNDEALYGLERVAQWVVEHENAGGEDVVQETLYAASLACGAHFHKESALILEAAKRLAEHTMNKNLEGALPFSVVMDMFEITQDNRYFDYAKRIFPGISADRIEPLLVYEEYTSDCISATINIMFTKFAEQIIKNANNPFGLTQAISEGQRGFFLWKQEAQNPLKGSNARILAAVEIMAQAYRYTANYKYKNFVYDQINWILGNNPYNVCLIAGLCDPDMPSVTLPEGWTLADADGFVLNGIGPSTAEVDSPQFAVTTDDISENTNGFSLYNNARYISAMAYLKRIFVTRPLKATL